MGDREETQGPVVLGLSLLRCIPGLTRHALSGLRACPTVDRASTMSNYAECQGLLHGLRQAKANNYIPLHVVGDSAVILSQLLSHHSPRKAHLALLFRKARDLADDIAVVSWGHHYRTFNQMADRLANFAMDSCTLVQVHLPSDRRVVKEVATFVDSDVTHWL